MSEHCSRTLSSFLHVVRILHSCAQPSIPFSLYHYACVYVACACFCTFFHNRDSHARNTFCNRSFCIYCEFLFSVNVCILGAIFIWSSLVFSFAVRRGIQLILWFTGFRDFRPFQSVLGFSTVTERSRCKEGAM